METKPHIIDMPEPLGLYAGQLYARGEEYLEAFRRLSEHDGLMMYARYFMMAHAFELLLKSFLAARGVSKKELQHRQLGHRLDKIYEKCVSLGIPAIANIEAFARDIAEKNGDFDFRYPSNYNLRLPSPRLCLEVLDPLVETLRPLISSARTQAQIKWASDTRHLQGHKIRWSD
ncbi:hypothetical protein [Rhizobium leguminosarum]|uniref:hypothetical protein n=1 Tax=Rhizobium leguminosarum TaxID=384 RepID=UPI00143F9D12|nr:hypothetical protein [Rhizobium leguminosarum]NKL23099.1 hypothetical protein [Rhizobium leguminosarum bv. viciae]